MEIDTTYVVLIEANPDIKSLIADQALIPLGYRVEVFGSASKVIQEISTLSPDVIITDLNLDDLSGKDLMIALSSLGSTIPIIAIAKKGQDSDILQAIRLGASDFLIYPVREAEIVRVVERTLKKSRLEHQIEQTRKELDTAETTIRHQQTDFSEIFSFYKLALSNAGEKSITDHICSLALRLAQADAVWLSIHDESQSNFNLQACHNLPDEMRSRVEQPYVDELSELVATSGQPISLAGDAIIHYNTFEGFGAALVVPFMDMELGTSVLAAARIDPEPFTQYQLSMLELVTAIASFSLQTERRKIQLEHMLVYLQQANIYATLESNLKYDLLRQASLELRTPLKYLMECVDYVLDRNDPARDQEGTSALNSVLEQAEILMDIADSMISYRQSETIELQSIDLNDVVRSTANRFRPIAQLGKININLELPDTQATIMAYSSQIMRVIEGLLSNALKYSPTNSDVTVRIEPQDDNIVLSVIDQGNGIDEKMVDRIFEFKSGVFGIAPKRFGGIGISLPRIKEIISAYKGQIWVESNLGNGFTVKITLPRQARSGQ